MAFAGQIHCKIVSRPAVLWSQSKSLKRSSCLGLAAAGRLAVGGARDEASSCKYTRTCLQPHRLHSLSDDRGCDIA